jgi:hypothetical protein
MMMGSFDVGGNAEFAAMPLADRCRSRKSDPRDSRDEAESAHHPTR